MVPGQQNPEWLISRELLTLKKSSIFCPHGHIDAYTISSIQYVLWVTSEKMAKNVTGGVKIENGIFSFICVRICCQHPGIYEINEGNTF